jgi:hypothetical protein
MVRGVRVETNPSGSYTNASQGVFASANVMGQAPSITVGISLAPGGFTLNWNSMPGATYGVLASSSLNPPHWTNISGTIIAGEYTMTWSRPVNMGTPQSYFEIASP